MAKSRFPRTNTPITSSKIRRFLEKENIPVSLYCEWAGSPILMDFFKLNSRYSLKDWAKLVVENKDTIMGVGY